MAGNPTPPTPAPSAVSQDVIVAASAAGAIAQAILTATGYGAIGAVIPLVEQLFANAIKAFTAANGAPPTVAQLQALLGDVPLVPPTK